MPDPLTLATVSAVALTEGIKFLYGQAGEALKRWGKRKLTKTATAEPTMAEPVSVQLPADAFDGQLREPRLHLDAVARLEQELRDLRAAVADYAQGIDEVDPNDKRLLEKVDGLRLAMEAVYGQRIVFKGEAGPSSGTAVVGEVKVKEVLGYVAGLRAKQIISGSATGRVETDKVGPGAQAVGLDAETIGLSPPEGVARRKPASLTVGDLNPSVANCWHVVEH
jgi:hypothetical protein